MKVRDWESRAMALSKTAKLIGFCLLVVPAVLGSQAIAQSTLTIGHPLDIRSLDPRVTPRSADEFILYNVFDTLLNIDDQGRLVPGLANKWEVSDDSRSVTLYLRKDVRFHDGTPFNAEALKFTFDSIKDPKLGSLAATDSLGPYDRTEVLDEHTVRVIFAKPFAPFLNNATTVRLAPVSPSAAQKMGNAQFAERPVGTGPFKVERWIPRDRVILVRNDDYRWGPAIHNHTGPGKLERLVFRILPDAFTRVSALEAGEVNMIAEAPAGEVKRLQAAGYRVMSKESPGLTRQYFLNTAQPPTDELAVRKGILFGVDRKEIIERNYFGGVTVAYGPLGPTTFGYWKGAEAEYAHDPKKAQDLLEEAGWKVAADGIRERNGKKLIVQDLTRQENVDEATLIQSQLRKVGIDWHINLVTTPVRNQRIQANDYNAVWGFWNTIDPDIMRNMFSSGNTPSEKQFGYSWSKHKLSNIDALLDQGVAVTDEAKRKAVYEELQRVILDNALTLPIINTIQTVVYDAKVHGLKFHNDPYVVDLYEAEIK
jgi:peptide/nickel transport system substrate-binding protein